MAQSVVIRSVTYQNVPSVEIPLSGGIDAGDVVLIAPEVVGFDSTRGSSSVSHGYSLCFGRQQLPSAVSAENLAIWERKQWNMGWFPEEPRAAE